MEVKPYQSDQSKKKEVEQMFDNIAPSYDLLNHLLSLGIDIIWRKKSIRKLVSKNPRNLLDIATGTGDLAIEAHKILGTKEIVGLDLSHEMLEVGRKKIKKRKLENIISMIQGDSENLPFEDNKFEAITAGFGVRNFENLDKGLEEMYRVMQDEGELVILEFTKPRSFPFKQLFNTYFKYILPVIGKIKSGDSNAYNYLYESVQAFPDYDDFLRRLENAGFKNPKYEVLSLGICSIYTAKK